MAREEMITNDDPLYHDTWKLLKKYKVVEVIGGFVLGLLIPLLLSPLFLI